MKARIAVPIVTLIFAAFNWPMAQSDAAVVGHRSDASIAIQPETANDHDGVYGQASSKHGLFQFERKGDTVAAVRPQLKPDYPCQNLHVRELDCPSR
jgi:hypothetical protein